MARLVPEGTPDPTLIGGLPSECSHCWSPSSGAASWPTSDIQPFADFINETPKHVVTSSTPDQEWANATLVTTAVTEYVTALKQQPGGDIGIHGSIDLARSLLRARLVDELRLVVAPALVGSGRRVLDEVDAAQSLELLDVQRSPMGTLFADYRCET